MHMPSNRNDQPSTSQQAYPVLSDHETFLTCAEYSARFKRAKSTLADDRRKGVGAPFIRSGKKILYPLSMVLEYHASTGSLESKTPVVLVDSTKSKRANVARKAAANRRGQEF